MAAAQGSGQPQRRYYFYSFKEYTTLARKSRFLGGSILSWVNRKSLIYAWGSILDQKRYGIRLFGKGAFNFSLIVKEKTGLGNI